MAVFLPANQGVLAPEYIRGFWTDHVDGKTISFVGARTCAMVMEPRRPRARNNCDNMVTNVSCPSFLTSTKVILKIELRLQVRAQPTSCTKVGLNAKIYIFIPCSGNDNNLPTSRSANGPFWALAPVDRRARL